MFYKLNTNKYYLKIVNAEDLDPIIDEIVNSKDFETSALEVETFESIEESEYPQEYECDQPSVNNLEDLIENS